MHVKPENCLCLLSVALLQFSNTVSLRMADWRTFLFLIDCVIFTPQKLCVKTYQFRQRKKLMFSSFWSIFAWPELGFVIKNQLSVWLHGTNPELTEEFWMESQHSLVPSLVSCDRVNSEHKSSSDTEQTSPVVKFKSIFSWWKQFSWISGMSLEFKGML